MKLKSTRGKPSHEKSFDRNNTQETQHQYLVFHDLRFFQTLHQTKPCIPQTHQSVKHVKTDLPTSPHEPSKTHPRRLSRPKTKKRAQFRRRHLPGSQLTSFQVSKSHTPVQSRVNQNTTAAHFSPLCPFTSNQPNS